MSLICQHVIHNMGSQHLLVFDMVSPYPIHDCKLAFLYGGNAFDALACVHLAFGELFCDSNVSVATLAAHFVLSQM